MVIVIVIIAYAEEVVMRPICFVAVACWAAGSACSESQHNRRVWHIEQEWPAETRAWIKEHEVDEKLRERMTRVLLTKDTLPWLSNIYKGTVAQRFREKGWEEDLQQNKQALGGYGFEFLRYGRVFVHEKFPDCVFKIDPNEPRNLGRVVCRDYIGEWLKTVKDAPAGVIVPEKRLYIMPSMHASVCASVAYEELPKVIVVAQRLKQSSSPEPVDLRKKVAEFLLERIGFEDCARNPANLMYVGDNCYAMIDLELTGFASDKRLPLPGLKKSGFVSTDFADDSGKSIVQYGRVEAPSKPSAACVSAGSRPILAKL